MAFPTYAEWLKWDIEALTRPCGLCGSAVGVRCRKQFYSNTRKANIWTQHQHACRGKNRKGTRDFT